MLKPTWTNFQTLQHKPNRGRKLTLWNFPKAIKTEGHQCINKKWNPIFMVHTSQEHIGTLYRLVYKKVKSRLHRYMAFPSIKMIKLEHYNSGIKENWTKSKKFDFSKEISDENRFLQFSSIFLNFQEISITRNMRFIEHSM